MQEINEFKNQNNSDSSTEPSRLDADASSINILKIANLLPALFLSEGETNSLFPFFNLVPTQCGNQEIVYSWLYTKILLFSSQTFQQVSKKKKRNYCKEVWHFSDQSGIKVASAVKPCHPSPLRLSWALSYVRSSNYVGVKLFVFHISFEAAMKTLCCGETSVRTTSHYAALMSEDQSHE